MTLWITWGSAPWNSGPSWGLNVQNTLKSAAVFTGLGLHSGEPVRMVVTPAPAESGPSKRAQQMIEEAKRLAQQQMQDPAAQQEPDND